MTELIATLLKSLGTHPKHTFQFTKFNLGSGGKITTRQFNHTSLEVSKGQELNKYVSFVVFHANLNQPENESSHMYILGAYQNVAMMKRIYPGWIPLIYIDSTSYNTYRNTYDKYIKLMLQDRPDALIINVKWLTRIHATAKLTQTLGLTVKNIEDLAGVVKDIKTQHKTQSNTKLQFIKTMWRFFPAAYNCVMISRDTDSRVNMREAYAVREWINSDYTMHRIFDSVFYANPILAGMFGTKPMCAKIVGSTDEDGLEYFAGNNCPAIPDMQERIKHFMSSKNLNRGYGIDELSLGLLDKINNDLLYANTMTHGYGSFFSSTTSGFTLFKDHQSVKLGRKLYSLMPCKGPKYATGSKHIKQLKSGVYMGRDTSFIGENLEMGIIDSSWIELIIHLTRLYAKNKPLPTNWSELYFNFDILDQPPKKDLSMSIDDFSEYYDFDKRFLPQYWYCFDRIIMSDVVSFSRINTIVINEYELRVLQVAYRKAVSKYPKVFKHLLKNITAKKYNDKLLPDIEDYNALSYGAIYFNKVDVSKFFKTVLQHIKQKSMVFKYLSNDLKYDFWYGCLIYYPYTIVQSLNLEF